LIDRIQAVRMRQKHFFTIYDGMAEDPRLRNILAGMLEKWVWSAHSLNRLVTCRFQFLVTGLWQVAKEDQSGRGFRRGEEGEWIHEILCRFFHEQREGKWNFRDETLELVRLNEIADEVLRTRLDAQEGEERDPFYVQMETKRLKQKLAAFWGHEKRWRTEKRFFSAPSYLELSFGLPVDFEAVSKGLVDPWSTPEPVTLTFHDGTKLKLKGKIDRVDQDEEEFYAVYDYKTGSTSRVSNEDIKAGKELQPFLYLKALIQGFGYDPAKAIGGGFYTKGSRAGAKDHRNKGLWRKEEMARIAVTTTKALDRMEWEETQKRIERLIAEQLRLVQQGNFAVDPTWNCPEFCPARQLCRVDTWSKTDNRQAREKEGDTG
jgi:ATP-dependent helicase/DNAse subunit B